MKRFVVFSSKQMLISGLVLGVSTVGCHSRQGQVQPDRTYVRPETNGIDRRVAEAKRAGKTSVQIQIFIQRAGVREIKDAFKNPEVFTGTPIQSVVGLNKDRNYVETWYKFRVDEDLTRKVDINDSSPVPAEMEVPSALLPLAKDEILVMGRGGTIMVDGVLVKSTVADEPWVEMNRRYLIFVQSYSSFSTPSSKVFSFSFSDDAVFYVGSDNDTVTPVWKVDSVIQTGMKRQFHNSLARLRPVARRQTD